MLIKNINSFRESLKIERRAVMLFKILTDSLLISLFKQILNKRSTIVL